MFTKSLECSLRLFMGRLSEHIWEVWSVFIGKPSGQIGGFWSMFTGSHGKVQPVFMSRLSGRIWEVGAVFSESLDKSQLCSGEGYVNILERPGL